MKIHLNEKEIIKGISLYVQSLGISLQGKTLEVLFTAGRKNRGLSADLVITQDNFVLNDDPAETPSPLIKENSDALVPGTLDAAGNVGNEARVSEDVETSGDAEEIKKPAINLFG